MVALFSVGRIVENKIKPFLYGSTAVFLRALGKSDLVGSISLVPHVPVNRTLHEILIQRLVINNIWKTYLNMPI